MFGLMGKVLLIDLSSKIINEEKLDINIIRNYLGGRGYGSKILYDRLSAGTEPFSPENLLIFATGPLTGTTAPTSGRFSVSTKSPLSGTILDANSGGRWGVKFKKTGYDALIISGKSENPCYIIINNNDVKIKEAGEIWGKLVDETTDYLLNKEGENSNVLCIGPAGENLVLISSIMNEKDRALGRGGAGAVMGSKNLKAVVVNGTESIKIADKEKMKLAVYESNKMIRANPITSKGLPEFGTSVLVNIINESGIFPTRNFQYSQFEKADDISGESITEKILVKKAGCWGCVIQCARKTRTKSMQGEGPEYESNWAFGADCGINDIEFIAEASYLCNQYGLDTISTGATIACAMEMNEKGIINTGLKFGDTGKIKEIIKKVAYREGIGDELADGSKRFAERYNAPQYSMTVKGLELPGYDPRGAQGQGVCYATTNRGGCHLRGGYMIAPEILGSPRMIDRFRRSGKSGLIFELQNLGAVADSLVVCRFSTFAISEIHFARLFNAVTGENITSEDLLKIGERIFNIERLFNIREGFSRKDDTLPDRLLKEPVRNGPAKGYTVHLNEMLDEFYEFRGWDKNGIPTREKLKELGLEFCRSC
ncbi:aldehyde ferredoxin oxidoreductase [candidate division KSB1 bacterium]|nr:MAG: aldehyde ferredoxin oxidoreductase [candidate division KSB1 bacterium]